MSRQNKGMEYRDRRRNDEKSKKVKIWVLRPFQEYFTYILKKKKLADR